MYNTRTLLLASIEPIIYSGVVVNFPDQFVNSRAEKEKKRTKERSRPGSQQ